MLKMNGVLTDWNFGADYDDEVTYSIQEKVEMYGKTGQEILADEAEVLATHLWDVEAFLDESMSEEHEKVLRVAQKADQRMERRREAAGGSVW